MRRRKTTENRAGPAGKIRRLGQPPAELYSLTGGFMSFSATSFSPWTATGIGRNPWSPRDSSELFANAYINYAVQYRPAVNGYPGPSDDVSDDKKSTAVVELQKKEGCGLGLIIAGGLDKGVRPHISNLRPGGIAHRSDSLEVGDTLLSVNGIKTSNMKHDEIINLMKNIDDVVRLDVEYELPECGPADAFSVRCKQHTIVLDTDGSSFGFVIRGGMHPEMRKCRPLTVTHIRPGGSADREGSLKIGDRILAVNDFSVVSVNLADMMLLLQQCDNQTSFTVEYDISLIDAVAKATGPLLIEIDKTPGAALGLSLSHARHKGKHCVCIDNIRPMSIADRCGALHMGDHILSIDGADVEHMTVAEATQLLKSNTGEQIRLEILPIKLIDQKPMRDSVFFGASGLQKHMVPSVSSPVLPTSPNANGFGPSRSYNTLGYSGKTSMEMLGRSRHRSWVKSDKKMASCASVASTSTSVFTASNQVCRVDSLEITLYGERTGLGLVLDATVFSTAILDEPPVVTRVESNTAAERCGVIQEGDRVLSINGQDVCEKTLEEVNQMLQENWQHIRLEIEFDVTEAVTASSGTFVVKLRRRPCGIGIKFSTKTKLGNPIVITDVKKGSISHRCGTVQAGDRLLAINDIRTENLSVEEASNLLKGDDEIIKLKLKRDDPYMDSNGEECVSYTVALERHGGPLGITISGTDDPLDPIVISGLAEGGLADRTGAIHVGDRLLSINGDLTTGKTLTEATQMLQSAGDTVTLRIARPATSTSKSKNNKRSSKSEKDRAHLCKSTTPVRSIDSALESWDSSGQENGNSNHSSKPRPQSVSIPKVPEKRKARPYSTDSMDAGDIYGDTCKLAELRISDDAWEGDLESSHSDSSPEDEDDWSKAFQNFEAQSEMLKQIADSMKQRSTGSLDRKSLKASGKTKERQKVKRNWSTSTSRGAVSQSDLRPYMNMDRSQRRSARSLRAQDSDRHLIHDKMKTVFAPQPIQLHRVTLIKPITEKDFGFGLSDGVYDKGVYISAVRACSVAANMGLKEFDRILQVNGKRTRDFDCSLTIPLIMAAGNYLDIVVCRNPLTHQATASLDALEASTHKNKPLPPDPPTDSDVEQTNLITMSDGGHPYVNVYNLDTPIARSEKSCKTV